MDDDEIAAATYHQLLEQFGDMPEVHTYHELSRKFVSGLTLEENIAFVEAAQFLFPNETNRKTLVWLKWRQAKEIDLPAGAIAEPTEEDLAYLYSHGIQVMRTPTSLTIYTGP